MLVILRWNSKGDQCECVCVDVTPIYIDINRYLLIIKEANAKLLFMDVLQPYPKLLTGTKQTLELKFRTGNNMKQKKDKEGKIPSTPCRL